MDKIGTPPNHSIFLINKKSNEEKIYFSEIFFGIVGHIYYFKRKRNQKNLRCIFLNLIGQTRFWIKNLYYRILNQVKIVALQLATRKLFVDEITTKNDYICI